MQKNFYISEDDWARANPRSPSSPEMLDGTPWSQAAGRHVDWDKTLAIVQPPLQEVGAIYKRLALNGAWPQPGDWEAEDWFLPVEFVPPPDLNGDGKSYEGPLADSEAEVTAKIKVLDSDPDGLIARRILAEAALYNTKNPSHPIDLQDKATADQKEKIVIEWVGTR